MYHKFCAVYNHCKLKGECTCKDLPRHTYHSHTSEMSFQSAQLFVRLQKARAHDIHMLRSRSLVTDVVRVPMLVLHNIPRMGSC